jgi:putative ABC transport system ATP-binding protein
MTIPKRNRRSTEGASPTASAGGEVIGATPCFRTRGLTKVYGTGSSAVHALRGVDLDLPEGEMVVVLGASGSGKSTFLNILGGLDSPTGGQVFFRGEDISRADQRELTEYRRRHVGFVFQFYNLMPSLTAWENVALVTEIAEAPLPPEEALAMVGLENRLNHFPTQLSGGEQQRVAIARAVAKQPSVLLCDEPTGALDSATGVRVLEALRTVNDRLGATTLVITHNAGIAAMADRVVRFADGQVREVRENADKRPPSEISW